MPKEFLAFSDVLAISLLALAFVGVLMAMAATVVIIWSRVVIKCYALNVFLLLVLKGCFVVTLLFVGEPKDLLCQLRETSTMTSLTVLAACLFAMTVTQFKDVSSKFQILNFPHCFCTIDA